PLTTVKLPSVWADTLTQNAWPLCAGGGAGGCPGTGAGGVIGAIGSVSGCVSSMLAMNMPGAVYSCPPSSEKCTCQRSSRPGDENTVFIVGGCPPLRMPLFMMMTRGRNACTSGGEFEIA